MIKYDCYENAKNYNHLFKKYDEIIAKKFTE